MTCLYHRTSAHALPLCHTRSRPLGQATAEFALTSIILFGLLLGILDLGRAGFTQHNLDSAADNLADTLAGLSGTNSSSDPNTYSPTPLDPLAPTTGAQIQAALVHAAQIANGGFNASAPLQQTGPMTLTNGQVTVAGAPNLTAPTEVTVTITAPFTAVVGIYLKGAVMYLHANASALTQLGESGDT